MTKGEQEELLQSIRELAAFACFFAGITAVVAVLYVAGAFSRPKQTIGCTISQTYGTFGEPQTVHTHIDCTP